MVTFALASALCAGQPPPSDWTEPSAPARLVFERPADEHFCLLAAPAEFASNRVTGCKLQTGDGSHLPARLVWSDAAGASFLADCQRLSENQEAFLYLLTNAAPPKVECEDRRPVRFYAQRTAGQDLPATWEQLRILDARVDRDPVVRALADFDLDDDSPSGWYRGDWQRKNHLVEFSSWVLFPTSGRFVFGMKTDLPMWLAVDDVCVLEHRTSRRTDWASAQPKALSAGLHHVVLRGATRQDLHLSAGWSEQGRTNAPEGSLVTGGDWVRARLERRDRRLHALALATPGHPYIFEGVTNVFQPVRLESRSVSWDGSPLACTWRLDGRELGTGRTLLTVLPARATPACIELTVADGRGEVARDVVTVAADRLPRNVYRVSGRLLGVPAVGYDEDPVRPEIQVRASSPDDVEFDVEAAIEGPGGAVTNLAAKVSLVRAWGRVVLPPDTADAFGGIAWRVLLAGVVLDTGTTLFDRTPFRHPPDALDGDVLMSGTNSLMLVVRRASAGDPRPFEGLRHGQRLLLLDGFLVPGSPGATNAAALLDARLAREDDEDAAASMSYRRLDLRAMESAASGDGVARLMPLVQLCALPPTDVIVLAPSFDGPCQGEPVGQFERRLGAMVGLLSGPGHATVVLVTPPPFDVLPGCDAGGPAGPAAAMRPPDARELAEVVCRVADAYGMPVVDLYTGFMTAGHAGGTWTCRDALTTAGMEQAAEMLRRVLYGPRKAVP